jgi:hypothetical protein
MEPVEETVMPECLHGMPLDTECPKCAGLKWDEKSAAYHLFNSPSSPPIQSECKHIWVHRCLYCGAPDVTPVAPSVSRREGEEDGPELEDCADWPGYRPASRDSVLVAGSKNMAPVHIAELVERLKRFEHLDAKVMGLINEAADALEQLQDELTEQKAITIRIHNERADALDALEQLQDRLKSHLQEIASCEECLACQHVAQAALATYPTFKSELYEALSTIEEISAERDAHKANAENCYEEWKKAQARISELEGALEKVGHALIDMNVDEFKDDIDGAFDVVNGVLKIEDWSARAALRSDTP